MAKEIIDSVEKLEEELARVREAQRKFSTYTQEQVDKIFLAAAKAANMARIPLAKMAVEETGMGVVEDKIIKNHYAAEYIYNKYKNTKTCGVIDEDKAYGTKRIAEPLGVICAVIPTTNPTSTAIFKTLISLKTRNGIIISPHPRAKKSTAAAAKIVLDAAVAAGAPENIISWIDAPSLDMTNLLMKEADIILATGGPGMVKAAYSSGKPALGVGAGNTPAIIDESADILKAVNSIIHSKTFDNGMICASEQSTIVDKKIYKEVRKEFEYRGCYFLKKDELDKVRKTIIINGALNAKIVGQKPVTIAALAGVKIPEDTKVLIGEVESVDLSEEFAHEKLSPVLAMYKSENFEDALAKAEKLIADGRIHPARIEEMVEKARREVESEIKRTGERAVLDAGVHNIHPELVKLLGRLRYRTSYGQNVLDHSLEVSYIAGMMASELGLDPTIAKRAGLLHDIGKSIDHEVEGTHIQIGVDLAKKYKESDAVIHAIHAHHGDVEARTIVACLVQAADAISAARPGARRENVENYIKRLQKLEEVASSFDGVERTFAIQAGREVRVMVKPEIVNDERMIPLARDICKKIEEELEYPGQIKVNIIRESRASDFAK